MIIIIIIIIMLTAIIMIILAINEDKKFKTNPKWKSNLNNE